MNCEQIRELLEAYVLGILDSDTEAAVAKHLSECADCRRLADEYIELISRLPEAVAAVSPVQVPDFVKVRLFQAIEASQPSAQAVQRSIREMPRQWRLPPMRLRFQQVGTLVILALMIFSVFWIAHLNTALAHEQSLRESLESQTELIFEVVDSDQTTRHFLRATENAPRLPDAAPPYGKVFIRADLPYVISMTGRLPPPPAGQVYNLWLFSEGYTVLAGTLMPDDAGFGTLMYQASENGPLYESAQLILQDEDSTTPSGVAVLIWHPNGEN